MPCYTTKNTFYAIAAVRLAAQTSVPCPLPFDPMTRIFTIRHMEPCIIIHGGCRTIPDEYQESVRQGVKLAARKGYEVLLEVKRAFKILEMVQTSLSRVESTSSTRKQFFFFYKYSLKKEEGKTIKCVLIDALKNKWYTIVNKLIN